ncbi:MAG: hypothetical protein KR126chlam4_00199 [Candidatus Anoxychlamydiales bacterium]|nr:hypothetical protein [Candidatus Anoxychlamydiales bacterium]
MKLKEYLKQINITAIEFSMICRISHPVLYRIFKGKNVSQKTAKIIYKKTKGMVKYENVYIPAGCLLMDVEE